jgi:methyl-accepting chemotaxis protein
MSEAAMREVDMAASPLPTGARLRVHAALLEAAVSLPALAVIVVYLHSLLDLSPEEWVGFAWIAALHAVVIGGISEPLRHRALAPAIRYLDARAVGAVPPELSREAFASVIRLPQRFQRMLMCLWAAAAVSQPVIMQVVGYAGWGVGYRGVVLWIAGMTGALVSSTALFFLFKRTLAPIRDELAGEIEDPEERRALVSTLSLSRKVLMVTASLVLASLTSSMTLAYAKAGMAVDELAVSWELRMLSAIDQRMSDAPGPARRRAGKHDGVGDAGQDVLTARLAPVLATLAPDPDLFPYPARFELLDPARADLLETLEMRTLLESVERGVIEGSTSKGHHDSVWAWKLRSDGSLLVASIPRHELRASLAGLRLVLAVVLIIAIGVTVGVASLLTGDLRQAVEALRAAVDRMAMGDLRGGRIIESEDELGELSRSFDCMAGALRTTVGSVVVAADRVEAGAGAITAVAESVRAASADQARRIQQANELMSDINGQVTEVSGAAQALNLSVEESSSSVLELGAAGDELNETASVLGGKVEDVSGSIEQMVRSVKQVGSSSEGLAEAAAETSASMEEMASAMRAVDTTAEMTANLSREVVSVAESGQKKVAQTINGMEAIRDATDAAERVIHGLGARTKEIGAILDVIDDVADETNLLALNAAIIAAQAGEHGRAFSVVADEIKELADRVLASTKEIGGLIRAVQDESNNAIGAIEEGSRSVASGVELAADAGISLEAITASSRESGTHISEIVQAVREQTKAASHVVSLMDHVRGGVDEIIGASGEQTRGNEIVHRSALTMREVAQQVRRTTEEQSRGFGRIRESVEGVREAVESIDGSLQEQSSACSQVADFLEQVVERTRSNEDAAQLMGEATRGLVSQAEGLRENVAKFRI